jgi:iron complex outermembrane receptor protein
LKQNQVRAGTTSGAAAASAMLLVGAQLAFGQAAEQNSNQAALPQSQQNTTEAEGIAEIVVTSQRRAQNLQDVPVAVTAVVGDTLLERGVVNLTDLPNLSPGLRVANPGNPAVITISIRGVGQRDINIHNEGAVALFVDGAYVSFTGALGQPLFDLDRVEVLKGPQGTLFGRNATGGVIQAISKKPTDELDAYGTIEYGSYHDEHIEGAVGGPLGSGWSGRLSLYEERADGYIKNGAGPNLNALKAVSGRLQLQYDNKAGFRFLLSGRVTDWPGAPGVGLPATPFILNANGAAVRPTSYAQYAAYCAAISQGINPAPPPGSNLGGNCYAAVANGTQDASFSADDRFRSRYYGVTGSVDWELTKGIALTSITDYQELHGFDYNADIDSSAAHLATYIIRSPKSWQASEEVHLSGDAGPLHWQAGTFFLDINSHVQNVTDLYNLPGFFISLPADYDQKTTSEALFAQADYAITPELTVTLGGRYTRDTKSLENDSTCISNPIATGAVIPGVTQCQFLSTVVFPGDLAFANYSDRFVENSWGGRAVLQWKPSDGVMLYGGVNRGPKSGGFNSGGAEFYPTSSVRFKAETLVSYEAGFKTTLLDRSLEFNGAAFYYDYKNFQTYSLVASGFEVLNVNASIKGAEFEVVSHPLRGLGLSLSGSYGDTRQTGVPLAGGGAGAFPIPDAPKWSFSGTVHYGVPAFGGEIASDTDVTYVDRRSISAIDYPAEDLPAYTRTDTRLSYTSGDKHWIGSLYVRNLTDRQIIVSRVGFENLTGAAYDGYDRPRWYGGSLTYRF